MSSEYSDRIQQIYREKIDALIIRKGYRGQTSFCKYDGVNCPVGIFNTCEVRPLTEQRDQAAEGKDGAEASRLNEKIREFRGPCGLDYFLGVDTSVVWGDIEEDEE
jgi:hypothetical protein